MPDQRILEHVRNSQFVVAGALERLGAANVSVAEDSPNLSIFKIDEILHGPAVLSGFAGKSITVLLADATTAKVGEPLILFAQSWLYGESLAVVEVARIEDKERNAMKKEIAEAHERLADERLLRRIESGELIVVGKVTAIEHFAGNDSLPITEHAPLYQVATVEIESVEKGRHEGRKLSLLFPGSTDAAWHDSPKFSVGQEGVWLIQRNQQERGWPKLRVPGLTALDPLDVHPKSRAEHIRALIKRGSR